MLVVKYGFMVFHSDLRGLGRRICVFFTDRLVFRADGRESSDIMDVALLELLGLGAIKFPDELLSEGVEGRIFFQPGVVAKTVSDHLLCPADWAPTTLTLTAKHVSAGRSTNLQGGCSTTCLTVDERI